MLKNIHDYLRKNILRYDILFASMVVCTALMIILPLPSVVIDFLLTISISISIVILIAVIFSEKPIDFSSFPTILLLSTLLRLTMNIASTRAILINGHRGTKAAGHIIETFGMFVMKGSVTVGIIIFIILTIINFIVITKGAGRIAEVSARFSLDAMPGKQMSIDADLSSGIINEETAKKRKSELEEESTFLGAMDGASKFVRGDAIAGILITFINFIGGTIIGTVDKHMIFSKAIKTYTTLTIGDGLVSQIPSLIVSIAAGILVSKNRTEGSTEKAIMQQISKNPKSLGLASAFLIVIGLIPGMPLLPFMLISSIMLFSIYQKSLVAKKSLNTKKNQRAEEEQKELENNEYIKIDAIKIELGPQILSIASQEGTLKKQVNTLKREFINELGFIMPQVRLQDNFLINGNEYIIKIKDINCAKGEIYTNMLLAMKLDDNILNDFTGKKIKEPVFGLPAVWINDFEKQKAISLDYTVVEPTTILIAHLRETVKDNVEDLISYVLVQNLISNIGEEYQKMLGEIIPTQVTINTLQRTLQLLLSEEVSIRDLPSIIELVAEASKNSQNIGYIVEYVRMGLSKQISNQYADDTNTIKCIVLSQTLENDFSKNITEEGTFIMPPNDLRKVIEELKAITDKITNENKKVIICKPQFRPHIRDIIKKSRVHNTIALSQNEIHAKYSIEIIAHL